MNPEEANKVFAAWTEQQQLSIVCRLDLTLNILTKLVSTAVLSPLIQVIKDALRLIHSSLTRLAT